MSKPEFVYVTYIETTPEKLWQALTSSEFTRRYWFGTELRSDWKVGSPFALVTDGADDRCRRNPRIRSAAAAVLYLQARADGRSLQQRCAYQGRFLDRTARQARAS